jgi:prolyl-tRNA synthetase
MHGDDHGLILPPNIAPIQVIAVPIPYKGFEEYVNEASKQIIEELKKAGIRAKADIREDITPGSKFYEWEMKGVPLRIEIGPRELQEGKITIVARDTLERKVVNRGRLLEAIRELFSDLTRRLRERSWRWTSDHLSSATSLDEARRILTEKRGIVEIVWCGEDECGLKLEEEMDARALGIPVDEKKEPVGNCLICKKEGKTYLRFARAY